MIFPEGTRFTPERHAQLLGKLRTKDPSAAAEAEQLTHVLPFRTGGVLALMDGAPEAALVFCAHTGYERIYEQMVSFDDVPSFQLTANKFA